MSLAQEAFNQFEWLRAKRRPYEELIEEIQVLFMPHRGDINDVTPGGTSRIGGAFDSTGMNAADALVNFIVGNVFPPSGDWMKLAPVGIEQTADIRDAMDLASDAVLFALENSNFYTEASQWLKDMIVLGNSTLYVEERPQRRQPDGTLFDGFDFEAVPFRQVWRHMDRNSEIIVAARKWTLSRLEAERFFDARFIGDMLDDVHVINLIRRSDKGAPHNWDSIWLDISQDEPRVVRQGKFDVMPYVFSVWDRTDQHQYGFGRGHLARPTARGMNVLKRHVIISAARDLNPFLVLENDSIVNADRASSGILIRRPGTEPPAYLSSGTNYEAVNKMAQDNMAQIERAFLSDILLDPDTQPRSAEESRQRLARGVTRISAPAQVVAIQLGKLVQMVVSAMRRGGALPQLDGFNKKFKVSFVSPFFTLQRSQIVQRVVDFVGLKVQMAQLLQDQSILDDIDLDKVSAFIAENSDVPQSIFRTEGDLTERRETRAEAEGNQRALDDAQRILQIESQTQIPPVAQPPVPSPA